MNGSDLLYELIHDGEKFIPLLIATSIILVVLIKTVGRMVTGSSRERTRREIAAFIAEGSMTPEQGERLLAAGDRKHNSCG